MKKNFRILSLFGVTTALLVAMLSSISAFAAPSGAVTGTITVDRDWYSNATSANNDVLVKVTDADANVTTAVIINDDVSLRNLGAGATVQKTLANTPIVGTPFFCLNDKATTAAACSAHASKNKIDQDGQDANLLISVTVVDATTGVVRFINTTGTGVSNDADAVDWTIDIFYNYSAVDYVKTTLKSTQEPNGNTIWLKETGKDTGIFTAIVDITPDATATDYGTLKTIYKGASGNLAAGAQSAAFNATVDHLDEVALKQTNERNGVWCVKSGANDGALADDNCAEAAGGGVTYVPGTLEIVSNTGVISGTATVKFTPTGALNSHIEINYPHDVVTADPPADNGLKALNLNTITAEYSDATPTSGATAVKVTDTASVETT
ncbi:MAG: hypothetical protein MK012_00005, partial [Dehalococcoidia bacterium]|nr:hypothetical protein [Dehalococcoidia bacterium]